MSFGVNRGQRPSNFWRAFALDGPPVPRRVTALFTDGCRMDSRIVRERSISLTNRDHSILHVLAAKVKILSLPQVHRTWWSESTSEQIAERRLKRLEQTGLLYTGRLLACEEEVLQSPLATWHVGERAPDFKKLLTLTRVRWAKELRAVKVVAITPAAAAMFGGVSRQVRPSEGSHDLHLTQVFLKRFAESPAAAKDWVSEGQIRITSRDTTGVIPDALIRRNNGTLAIEVVGSSYTASKLACFHTCCASCGWGYELW